MVFEDAGVVKSLWERVEEGPKLSPKEGLHKNTGWRTSQESGLTINQKKPSISVTLLPWGSCTYTHCRSLFSHPAPQGDLGKYTRKTSQMVTK